jgi:rubrerythrin
LKDLFVYLQNQEKKHYEDFKNLFHLLKEEGVSGLPKLSDAEEISLYLHTLANSKVFTDPEAGAKLGRGITDDSEAIDIAIGLERDSILYYNEMLNVVTEEDKGLVENIITQEKEHERLLKNMRK